MAGKKQSYPRNPRGIQYGSPQHLPDWAELDSISERLAGLIGEQRLDTIVSVISRRSYNLSILLEDVHDPHNIGAVLRSADAFGLQRVHVVFDGGMPKISRRISQGSHKWLDLYHYNRVVEAAKKLKADGYRIYTASFGEGSVPIEELDFSVPVVLALGNEHRGSSEDLERVSDAIYTLPMFGFARSYNISVAAALSLSTAVRLKTEATSVVGDLTDSQKRELLLRWLSEHVPGALPLIAEAAAGENEKG